MCCHTLGSIIWFYGRQVMQICYPPETFWYKFVHSNNSTSMVLPPSPLPFCSLRRSRALHCRGWLSRPHPRQLPPRVPMPQTATLLSTLLPLRRLLSLSPPLPSMPPPPLALVTRSADWTLWTKREGLACLPFLLFFLLSFACSSQCAPLLLLFPLYCHWQYIIPLLFFLGSMFSDFPPKNQILLKGFCKNKQPRYPMLSSLKWSVQSRSMIATYSFVFPEICFPQNISRGGDRLLYQQRPNLKGEKTQYFTFSEEYLVDRLTRKKTVARLVLKAQADNTEITLILGAFKSTVWIKSLVFLWWIVATTTVAFSSLCFVPVCSWFAVNCIDPSMK